MQQRLTIGLAQLDSRLGALEANLEKHLGWIERARAQDVDLLLFPELSLTGYRLLHLTSRVAIRPAESPLIARLLEAAGEMAIIVGVVEEDVDGVLYNSGLYLEGGEIVHVHRKLYLPTYGIFQEGRFFGPGKQLKPVDTDGGHVWSRSIFTRGNGPRASRMTRRSGSAANSSSTSSSSGSRASNRRSGTGRRANSENSLTRRVN